MRRERDVPIRLYRFKGQTRNRWAAAVVGVEGYGALPDEALRNLAAGLTTNDLAKLATLAESEDEHHG